MSKCILGDGAIKRIANGLVKTERDGKIFIDGDDFHVIVEKWVPASYKYEATVIFFDEEYHASFGYGHNDTNIPRDIWYIFNRILENWSIYIHC